jgi:hypothetical protein
MLRSIGKSLPEKQLFWLLFFIGIVLGFFRIKFSQDEDMGYLLSISSFVEHGYKLYTEIYEIKDPYFLYTSAISLKIFGIIGPFVVELILIAVSIPLAYLLGKGLTNNVEAALISSIVFGLVLTGSHYQAFRTQIFGIALFLACSLFIVKGKWFTAGFLGVVMLGYKMPMGAFLIGLAPFFYYFGGTKRKLSHFIAGTALSSSVLIIILFVRGELAGYIKMNYENISYAGGYQKIVGLPDGVLGHLSIWDGEIGRAKGLLICCILISAIVYFRERKFSRNYSLIFMWSVAFSTTIFLGLTALWPHHLQILSISAFGVVLAGLNIFLQENDVKADSLRKSKTRDSSSIQLISTLKNRTISSTTVLLSCFAVFVNSGGTFEFEPRMPIRQWANYQWQMPPEIALLEKIANEKTGEKIPVTRLGMVDAVGYGYFFNFQQFEYVCVRHGIAGAESKEVIEKFLNCISNEPEYLTLSPMFINGSRPGIYLEYRRKVDQVLKDKFVCEAVQPDGYQLCKRGVN